MVLIAQKMLSGASVDGDVGVANLAKLGCEETTHVISWGSGVGAGVVQIEAADSADYAGTWAPVVTMTFDGSTGDAPKQDYARIAGTYAALRHRVDGAIEGGTVDSRIDGSGAW